MTHCFHVVWFWQLSDSVLTSYLFICCLIDSVAITLTNKIEFENGTVDGMGFCVFVYVGSVY